RNCRLKETPWSGNQFSRAGAREVMMNGIKEKVWIQCKLDIAFGNAKWFRLLPRVHNTYLERIGSDHRPVITSLTGVVQQQRGKFSFDKRWCFKPEILEIVR